MDVDAETAAVLRSSRFAEEFLIRAAGADAAAPQGCCGRRVKVGSSSPVLDLGLGTLLSLARSLYPCTCPPGVLGLVAGQPWGLYGDSSSLLWGAATTPAAPRCCCELWALTPQPETLLSLCWQPPSSSSRPSFHTGQQGSSVGRGDKAPQLRVPGAQPCAGFLGPCPSRRHFLDKKAE